MKWMGLVVLSVLLTAGFATFAAAEESGTATAEPTTAAATIVPTLVNSDENELTDSQIEEVQAKCIIIATATTSATVRADCAVKYCRRPVTNAAEFRECLKKFRPQAFATAKPRKSLTEDYDDDDVPPMPTVAASGSKPQPFACKPPFRTAREYAQCAKIMPSITSSAAGGIATPRFGGFVATVGVEKVEAVIAEREKKYEEANEAYQEKLEKLNEWRKKKVADLKEDERKLYREAVREFVLNHIKRLNGIIEKLETEGVDVSATKAKIAEWQAAWEKASTKEEKMAVIKTVNSEWPALRQKLQDEWKLLKSDDLAQRASRIAEAARITADGVEKRGGDASGIRASADKVDKLATSTAALTDATAFDEAREELKSAIKELQEAVRKAVSALIKPASTSVPTIEASDDAEATATPAATATQTPTAVATATVTATA